MDTDEDNSLSDIHGLSIIIILPIITFSLPFGFPHDLVLIIISYFEKGGCFCECLHENLRVVDCRKLYCELHKSFSDQCDSCVDKCDECSQIVPCYKCQHECCNCNKTFCKACIILCTHCYGNMFKDSLCKECYVKKKYQIFLFSIVKMC